jgi:periplasmic divalent cation tolerance protein
MTDFIEVRTALPSQEGANKIAQHLVSKRLAASAQVSGPIASTYWWKGEMTNAEEWIVTAKTRLVFYTEVEQAIRHLHPYEEPGIIALPLIAGSASYFSWIAKETTMETQLAIWRAIQPRQRLKSKQVPRSLSPNNKTWVFLTRVLQ